MITADDNTRLIRNAALDLLGRREHARQEMVDKIYRRFNKRSDLAIDKAMIAVVVNELARLDLQSDTRYLASVARRRKHQGYGPVRIAQELRQKATRHSDTEIESYCSFDEVSRDEWKERARDVRCKKFGEVLLATQKEKAQQMRFLQYRGFSMEQIRFALSSIPLPEPLRRESCVHRQKRESQ